MDMNNRSNKTFKIDDNTEKSKTFGMIGREDTNLLDLSASCFISAREKKYNITAKSSTVVLVKLTRASMSNSDIVNPMLLAF